MANKVLRRDPDKCIHCRVCETMLTGFISEYNGELPISQEQLSEEATLVAIDDLISCCIGSAIQLHTV